MCKKHPRYKAVREPRADCLACWKQYAVRLAAEIEGLNQDLDTLWEDFSSLVAGELL